MLIATLASPRRTISANQSCATDPSSHQKSEQACLLDFMSPPSEKSGRRTVSGSRGDDISFGNAVHIVRCERGEAPDSARLTSRADALTLCVAINGSSAHSASSDECAFIAPARQIGEVTIYDRRYRWRFDMRDPFDCILFHIPRAVFDHMSANRSLAWSETVPGLFNGGRMDEVLGYLARATWAAFESCAGVTTLYVDHLAASATLHVVESYGVGKHVAGVQGGLGPWREAHVRELVGQRLHEPLPLEILARACNLSTSHFAREFKNSFGCSPHQWLRQQRLERAKKLMRTTSETLSEIAIAAGFADQSHMTRIFSSKERVSPAAWRRRLAHHDIALQGISVAEPAPYDRSVAYGR